jgi:hypothetical protein
LIIRAPPADRIAIVVPRGRTRCGAIVENVGKDVACMVQHDIHDHINAPCVRFVDKASEFAIRVRFVISKAGINAQEMLDSIAVVSALLRLAVLQHGTKPNRTNPESLKVAETLSDPFQSTALKSVDGLIPLLSRRAIGVIEAVDHEEVDPTVSPIGRRGKGAGDLDVMAVNRDRVSRGAARGRKGLLDFRAEN